MELDNESCKDQTARWGCYKQMTPLYNLKGKFVSWRVYYMLSAEDVSLIQELLTFKAILF